MSAKDFGNGTHDVVVSGSYLGKSKGDHDELQIDFLHEEHGYISAYLYFSEKAQEFTLRDLAALGWKPEDHDFDAGTLHQVEQGTERDIVRKSAIYGAKCRIVTEVESYEGKERVKVKFINGPRPQREELPPEQAKSQRVSLRKRLIANADPKKVAEARKRAKERKAAAKAKAETEASEREETAAEAPAPTPEAKEAERKERVGQAVADGIRNQSGGGTQEPEDDFDDDEWEENPRF